MSSDKWERVSVPPEESAPAAQSLEEEFDQFAEEYAAQHARNIRVTGEEPEYFAAYKIGDVRRELIDTADRGPGLQILDFGSGVGNSVPYFRQYFPDASLLCLDVSTRSLSIAEQRFGNAAEYVHFSGSRLPVPSESIDVAFSACVFHHIAPALRAGFIKELERVLRPGGWLFIFEHNPLNPLTVHAVNTCPFDKNARLLRASQLRTLVKVAGLEKVRVNFRIFFPRFLSVFRVLERYLRWCPLGAQYYVVGRKREND